MRLLPYLLLLLTLVIGMLAWALGIVAVLTPTMLSIYWVTVLLLGGWATLSLANLLRLNRDPRGPAGRKSQAMMNEQKPPPVMRYLATSIDLTGQVIALAKRISQERAESSPDMARELRIAAEGLHMIAQQLHYAEPAIAAQLRRLGQSVVYLVRFGFPGADSNDESIVRFANPKHRTAIASNLVADGDDMLSRLASRQDLLSRDPKEPTMSGQRTNM